MSDSKEPISIIKKMMAYIYTNRIVHYTELMELVHLSRRSVSKYLDILQEMVKKEGINLKRKQNIGIYFEGDKDKIEQIQRRISTNYRLLGIGTSERRNLLLMYLVMHSEPIIIDDLTEIFFVSKTTLSTDIQSLKLTLNSHQARIEKNKCGIYVEAPERLKRRLATKIISEYWQQSVDPNKSFLNMPLNLMGFTNKRTILKVQQIIEKFSKITQLTLTDYQYQSLFIHIVIMLGRIKNNNFLSLDLKQKNCDKTGILIRLLENELKITIPNEEINYLNIHILAIERGSVSLKDFNYSQSKPKELIFFLKNHLIDYDDHLINDLFLHLEPALSRFKLGLQIFNPYTEEIKHYYPRAFDQALVFSKQLGEKQSINIGVDEVAYVALHIEAFLERKDQDKMVKAVIVCSTGLGTAHLLNQRLMQKFNGDLVITRTLSVHNLFETRIQEDLIISTVPIEINYPLIILSPFLNAIESSLLSKKIEEIKARKENKFIGLLQPELIFPNDELNTTEQIITLLGNKLIRFNYAERGIIQSALSRENLASTASSDPPIALPHAESKYIKESKIAIYINPRGIIWGCHQVKIVFFVALNDAIKNELDNVYQHFNQILDDSKLLNNVINCSNSLEVINLLINHKKY